MPNVWYVVDGLAAEGNTCFCPNDAILCNKAAAFALIRPHAIPSRETNTTFYRLLLFLVSFLMVRAATDAKARLARAVGDDMVARRQTAVRLWGCGATGFEARAGQSDMEMPMGLFFCVCPVEGNYGVVVEAPGVACRDWLARRCARNSSLNE